VGKQSSEILLEKPTELNKSDQLTSDTKVHLIGGEEGQSKGLEMRNLRRAKKCAVEASLYSEKPSLQRN